MYRIIKTLNHNAVLATDMNDNQEYILLGKGIGFGKKVSERIDAPEDVRIYSLKHVSERKSQRAAAGYTGRISGDIQSDFKSGRAGVRGS